MREEVVGHDFRKRKLLTQTHHIQNFASQSGLLSKFCYAKPPTASAVFAVFDRRIMVMTFVNESCLWQPHRLVRSVGQSILLRKTVYSELCFAKWSSTTASWSKHFATQNGLRPPRFLRGAYFAVHKRLDLNLNNLFLRNRFRNNFLIIFKTNHSFLFKIYLNFFLS